MDLDTIPENETDKTVSYTIIVKDDDKKYSQVYAGSCCQSRIKEFTNNRTCFSTSGPKTFGNTGATENTQRSREKKGCCIIS
jgi:hypothetical protein